jgi:DNA-binding response OmpR family regulator
MRVEILMVPSYAVRWVSLAARVALWVFQARYRLVSAVKVPGREASQMEFRILGPLEVWDEGGEVSPGGRKPRALLTVLLLYANEVVSADRLIDELWGED